MSISKKIFILFACVCFCFFSGCNNSKKQVYRGFYYWKTDFRLNAEEEQRMSSLQIQKLYVRFFDVSLGPSGEAVPVAKIVFNSAVPANTEIIPVIFITNNTIRQIAPGKIPALGGNIIDLIKKTAAINKITYHEIQFDCDWSIQTKEKFFTLLRYAKTKMATQKLSCTIRLHQVKYFNKTGLPPVDRGMLMFYNMGELADTTLNSIFNEPDAKKYVAAIRPYPLPLDIALPVFCWAKHYRDGHIIGLLNNMKESDLGDKDLFMPGTNHHYLSLKDGFFHSEYIRHGDLLIAEEVTPSLAKKSAELLAKNFSPNNFTLVLYHWDSSNLSRYENKDLEDIYHRFD